MSKSEPRDLTLIYKVPRRATSLVAASSLVQQCDKLFSNKVLTGMGCFIPKDPAADVYLSFTVEIVPEANEVFGFLQESLLTQDPKQSLELLCNPAMYDLFVGMTEVVLDGLETAYQAARKSHQKKE